MDEELKDWREISAAFVDDPSRKMISQILVIVRNLMRQRPCGLTQMSTTEIIEYVRNG